jgi:hypothetical protein
VPGYGKVYYDEEAIANIFEFSELKKKYRITYDSDKEDVFLVHMNNKIIKFECSPDGLYQYQVSKDYQNNLKQDERKHGASNLVSTVTDNKKGYTQRQFERSKEARRLYHIVGTPTVKNFKPLLRMNTIKNCPATTEDINIAEKIFGKDISSLKGKSTRRKPKPVRQDLIEIPKELIDKHHNIELCMDTMYVNECGILTAIDQTIKFHNEHKTAQRVLSCTRPNSPALQPSRIRNNTNSLQRRVSQHDGQGQRRPRCEHEFHKCSGSCT